MCDAEEEAEVVVDAGSARFAEASTKMCDRTGTSEMAEMIEQSSSTYSSAVMPAVVKLAQVGGSCHRGRLGVPTIPS